MGTSMAIPGTYTFALFPFSFLLLKKLGTSFFQLLLGQSGRLGALTAVGRTGELRNIEGASHGGIRQGLLLARDG